MISSVGTAAADIHVVLHVMPPSQKGILMMVPGKSNVWVSNSDGFV